MTNAKPSNVRSGTARAAAEEASPARIGMTGASAVIYVTDTLGRKIGLKKLKRSERFTLNEATDPSTLSNGIESLIAASVFSIDGEAFTPMRSKAELLDRLDALGDECFAAITKPVMKMYGLAEDPDQDAKDKADAKN